MAKTKNNDKDKAGLITIIALIFLVLMAILFAMSKGGAFASPTVGSISLSRIDISVASEKGEHKLYVGLSVTGDSNKLNKLNMTEVQLSAKEHMKTLDYDLMTSENGMEYIKTEMLSKLNESFGDDITGVNVESMLTDFELPAEVDTSSTLENVLEGLKFGD